MITTKTLYKVPYRIGDNGLFGIPFGIWCTENIKCRDMTLEDAMLNSKCISNRIIDESIKDLLIFTFYDAVNYGGEKDEFLEVEYEELIAGCEPIEMVAYE